MTFEQWASLSRRPISVPPPRWVQDILGEESSYLGTPNIKGEYNRKGASERSGDGLATQLKYLATPRSSPNENRGKKRCPSAIAGKHGDKLPEQLGGQVNPDWKDWFMGLPIGWTATECLEMQSFQSWLRKHLLSF